MLTTSTYMGKYPIHTAELSKSKTSRKNMTDILAYFQSKIDKHPMAQYIATFNNYAHTKGKDGAINPEIKDAQVIIFCFGPAIPDAEILAVRPRSFGIAEHDDAFTITFLEAPKEPLQAIMQTWVTELLTE